MTVDEEDVPLMLQCARWYLIDTEGHLAKLPTCQCAKWKREFGPKAGPCGRCHTALQASRSEKFLAKYGGDR